jgi:dynein heavy chain
MELDRSKLKVKSVLFSQTIATELAHIVSFKNAVAWACIWSIGATSDTDSRTKFDELFRDVIRNKHPEIPLPDALVGKFEIAFPDTGTVYDFFFECKNKGEWRHWNELLRGTENRVVKNIRSMIVPTIDTVRTHYILDFCIRHKRPLLLCGPTGTGM